MTKKKHVFLSFNVEYGTNGHKNTVTLLDTKNGDDRCITVEANATHESMVRELAKWLLLYRLRIEDINMGVRA